MGSTQQQQGLFLFFSSFGVGFRVLFVVGRVVTVCWFSSWIVMA